MNNPQNKKNHKERKNATSLFEWEYAETCTFIQINFHLFFFAIDQHMRKPVYAICEQQRRRSACASAQSDQHLCCLLPG